MHLPGALPAPQLWSASRQGRAAAAPDIQTGSACLRRACCPAAAAPPRHRTNRRQSCLICASALPLLTAAMPGRRCLQLHRPHRRCRAVTPRIAATAVVAAGCIAGAVALLIAWPDCQALAHAGQESWLVAGSCRRRQTPYSGCVQASWRSSVIVNWLIEQASHEAMCLCLPQDTHLSCRTSNFPSSHPAHRFA